MINIDADWIISDAKNKAQYRIKDRWRYRQT